VKGALRPNNAKRLHTDEKDTKIEEIKEQNNAERLYKEERSTEMGE